MSNIKQILLKEQDGSYKNHSKSILPDVEDILGVRMPILRKIARNLYKNNEWQDFLKTNSYKYWEELMLKGMIIGEIKDTPSIILDYVKNFIPQINDWGVCDGFCASLKFTKNNKELVWEFIQPYFNSEQEFEKRFAFVMMLTYFIEDTYINKCFKLFDNFCDERYYAKMAVAWALSICYVKYPEKTFKYLQESSLDKWTYNKGIQKIRESLRIDKSTKELLKKMKK